MSTHAPSPQRHISLGFTPERYPEGIHICYLYSDEEERRRFMAAFVSSGIQQGEAVVYLADAAPEMLDLATAGLCTGTAPAQGQFTAATAAETYCPTGRFVPQAMLDTLHEIYTCRAATCEGVRGTGEMSWALHHIPGSERLIEYEAGINELLLNDRFTVLCQYDIRRFSGATIFELLNVHPFMIVSGQIMRNPFYVAPVPGHGATYENRDDQ
jgi:hypothetical protein